jgi:hypothetical protein
LRALFSEISAHFTAISLYQMISNFECIEMQQVDFFNQKNAFDLCSSRKIGARVARVRQTILKLRNFFRLGSQWDREIASALTAPAFAWGIGSISRQDCQRDQGTEGNDTYTQKAMQSLTSGSEAAPISSMGRTASEIAVNEICELS